MSFEYSTFPKNLDYPNDSTAYLSDLTAGDWEKIKKYNQALIDGNVTDAAEILKTLDGRHITAKDINKIIDCIRAIETAYFNNVVKNNDIVSNGDFNDMKTPGIYTMRASLANSPANEGRYYGLIVLKSDTANFIEQIAFKESSYNVYIRYLNNSGWGEWRKINDGGNADTLNGHLASDFAAMEHEHNNYLPLSGGTISGDDESMRVSPWGLRGNGNSYIENFNRISSATIEENGKSLTDKYSEKEHTHTIDEITDFNTDLIINNSDFTKYKIFTTLDELSEAIYEGLFYISDSQITGISLKSGQETDIQPDNVVYLDIYTRIYFDNNGNMCVAVDTHNDEIDFWSRKFLKTFSSNSDNHTHTKSQITDFPASLPANGGNAENAQFIKTYSDTNGYNTNNYGNFVHNGTSASDSWCITDNNVDPTFQVRYESGNVQAKGTMTAASFKGDGSGLTGVNATELSSRTINSIQTRDVGYCFYNRNKDWNDVTDVGYYGLMHSTSSALHNPVERKFFYPIVFKYADDSITQIAVPHAAGHDDVSGWVYIRSKNNSYNGWSEWKSIGDGCNASSVNKKTVRFNASAGNWYRLVKGKPHDNSDNTGACGIMTIMADAYNYHSCDVITVAENKGVGSFTLHNHGNFNEFFGKYRMVKGIDGYVYIDAFINSYNSNIDDLSATLTFTFSGIGWEVCNSIDTANANYGVVVSEKEL